MEHTTRASCTGCGWSGTLTSPARAAWAQRQHRCAPHRKAAEQRARHAARRAAVDHTPKPCRHKQANHQHGHYATYVLDECRCTPCTAANTAYVQRLTREKAYGRYDRLVDSAPVRAHIQALQAAGIGLKRVTALTGVHGGFMTKLLYGSPRPDGTLRPPAARVKRETADKILALRIGPHLVADGAKVDATGTRRRLQALVSLGWSQSELGRQLGMSPSNFGKTLRARQVVASTARAVAALYDRLWNTPAPADDHRQRISVSRAKRHATLAGWLPPLAWDDETIDDPNYQPLMSDTVDAELDEIAVERIMAGTLKVAKNVQSPERREAIRRLAARGLNDTEIANRVGMTGSAVGWTRIRHDIPAGVPSTHVGAA